MSNNASNVQLPGKVYNESNVDSRLRQRVRGRVIVFTTSPIVEFLTDDLTQSFPLYSYDGFDPQNFGLSFVVEVDGYLTFNPGCQVKIHEVAPYSNFHYDPKAWAAVRPADPFVSTITRPPVVGNTYGQFVEVYYRSENGSEGMHTFEFADISLADIVRLNSIFPVGSPWLGPDGYPGLRTKEEFV